MPVRVRGAVKWLLANGLRISGVLFWARRHLLRRRARLVLTFHRVLPASARPETCSPAGMCVSEDVFTALVHYLESNYQIQALDDAAPGPGDARLGAAITFDDGWRDNLPHLRSLENRNHPATVFLVTGRMNTAFPFWPERVVWIARKAAREASAAQDADAPDFARRFLQTFAGSGLEWSPASGPAALLEALKKLPEATRDRLIAQWDRDFWNEEQAALSDPLASTIGWDDARSFAGSCIRFGSHTVSHPLLDQTSEVERELSGSRDAISTQFGQACTALAYPNGNWTAAVRDAAAACGYRIACTTEERCQLPGCDDLLIPRFNMSDGKLANPWGRFSPALFELATVWKAWRNLPAAG